MPDWSWDDARYALAVARWGSLSEAGRRLGVEQSTVGRRLAALESALGERLFDRTRDGMTPASAAAELLDRFERMEAEALSAERAVTGRDPTLAGTVRLTAPNAFGGAYLARRLAALTQAHPALTLELVLDNRALNLSRREADLALRLARPTQASLVMRKIAEIGTALYASRDYLARRGWPASTDLRGHELIAYDDTFLPGPEVAWYAKHAQGARVAVRSNSTRAFLDAALGGAGLALLPCYLAEPHPELVRVRARVVVRPLWLVLHRELRHAARIKTVVDFLAAVLARDAALLRGPPHAAARATAAPKKAGSAAHRRR